jgi:O-antigen/teichoic acid export membrane protein
VLALRISFVRALDRFPRLARLIRPYAVTADETLHGVDGRSIARRITLIAFTVRILSAVIAYGSQVLLARWLGGHEYGIFVVVWTGATILGSLSCLGFQTAMLRFVPEYKERGEADLLRGVLLGSRVQGVAAATILAGLGLLGLHFFGTHVESYYLIPLYLGAVVFPMITLGEIQEGISRSFSWADLSLWPTFIWRPVLIIACMAGALVVGFPATAVTAMGAAIVATYATALFQLLVLQKRIRKAVPAGPRRYQPLTWVAVTLPIFLVDGFFGLLTNVDILIVSQFMTPDRVAIYFAAVKTMALVQFVYFAVRIGVAPRYAQYYAAGDRAKLQSFALETVHWTFWPSLAAVALILIVGKPLLSLFGPDFGEGYPLMGILAVGLLARASIGPAESMLTMAGHQRICAAVYTGAFILNVVLNFTLVPIFGLAGAAVSTATALVAESIAMYFVVAKRLGIRISIVTLLLPPRRALESG